MDLRSFSRRAWQNRTEAIRSAITHRRAAMSDVAGPLSDREKIDQEAALRVLRAQGSGGTEGK